METFVYVAQKFEQYIKKRRNGAAGAPNGTTKIAKAVFYFLISRATQEFMARKINNSAPSHNELRKEFGLEPHAGFENYDFDREFVGWVRATDIVDAVLPPHRRGNIDSSNAKLYPHKEKTLVYRVLSEMTELSLINRVEVSRKKTLYRVNIFPVDRKSDCANCSLWANRYLAALEILTERGIYSPEQQVDARLSLKWENSVHTPEK